MYFNWGFAMWLAPSRLHPLTTVEVYWVYVGVLLFAMRLNWMEGQQNCRCTVSDGRDKEGFLVIACSGVVAWVNWRLDSGTMMAFESGWACPIFDRPEVSQVTFCECLSRADRRRNWVSLSCRTYEKNMYLSLKKTVQVTQTSLFSPKINVPLFQQI